MTTACVEQWIRVPDCEEHTCESPQTPNQRHRSRPRLQSPDASLDRSSSTAGTPVDTAYGLWEDYTLTVNYFWQAPTTRWCSTTQCNLLQKLYALWSLSTRLTLLLRGVRRGTDTKDGLTTLRGPLSLRKSLHHLLHDDVQRTLNATRGNSHTSLWCTLKSNGVSCAPPPRRAGPCPEQVYALFLGCLAKVVLPLLHRHQVLLFSLDQLLAVGVETMSCKHVWRF